MTKTINHMIPLPLSTPEVIAMRDGKNVFRKVVKPQPVTNPLTNAQAFLVNGGLVAVFYERHPLALSDENFQIIPPYQIGDILYVKEGWRVSRWTPEDGEIKIRYEADGAISGFIEYDCDDDKQLEQFNKLWVASCDDLDKAGHEVDEEESYWGYDYKALRLRSPVTMPREAARTFLEVVSVEVIKEGERWEWEVGVKEIDKPKTEPI